MPAPRVINTAREKPEPSRVQQFFSRLGKDYKDKEDRVEIGNLIGEYQKNRESATAWEDLQLGLQKSNIGPTKRLEAQAELNGIRKNVIENDKVLNKKAKEFEDANKLKLANEAKAAEKTKKDAEAAEKSKKIQEEVKEILLQGEVPIEEADRLSNKISVATARSMVKKTKGPQDKFEEILATEGAKEVPKLEQAISKGKDTLENIDTIEKLATENLSGLKGYVKAAFNTEAASQLQTLGATNLDTVIKLFNPAGTLPTAKLNWIRSTFSVSPWDNLSTIKGKLNTQKTITNQSIERANERKNLLKRYNGNIPENVAKDFDKETGDKLDALKNELSPQIEKQASEQKIKVKAPDGTEWIMTQQQIDAAAAKGVKFEPA